MEFVKWMEKKKKKGTNSVFQRKNHTTSLHLLQIFVSVKMSLYS